jgi:hypothetical protein
MSCIDALFEGRIPYCIEGGTLLGAIRHGEIIPWDDDIDLRISWTYERVLRSLAFAEYNIVIQPSFFGYKVYFEDGQPVAGTTWKYPSVDIFVCAGRHFANAIARRLWPKSYINRDELLPLKQYQLGPIQVWGPNNPIPYLDRTYGADWRVIGRLGPDHSTEQERHGTITLTTCTDHNRIPAFLPLEVPPEDRVVEQKQATEKVNGEVEVGLQIR